MRAARRWLAALCVCAPAAGACGGDREVGALTGAGGHGGTGAATGTSSQGAAGGTGGPSFGGFGGSPGAGGDVVWGCVDSGPGEPETVAAHLHGPGLAIHGSDVYVAEQGLDGEDGTASLLFRVPTSCAQGEEWVLGVTNVGGVAADGANAYLTCAGCAGGDQGVQEAPMTKR